MWYRDCAAYSWDQSRSTQEEEMTVDQDKLMDFLHKFVGDLGATIAAGSVLIGDRLGFYRALADQPLLPRELAERTGTATRYVDEWLRGQAAGGYVQYDPQAGTYSLTPEQAFALTDPDGAVYVPGAFQLALGTLRAEDQVTEAFRTGAGIGWHQHDDEVFTGCERFFRPGYTANLVSNWLPALDGVEAKLGAGARVADVGCGHGASTVLMAKAYPNSEFTGSDYHAESVQQARKRAADAGLADHVSFDVHHNETLGIVGESGSGKSVTSMAILGLLPSSATITGSVLFRGEEVLGIPEKQVEKLRGSKIAMVFQDALAALNPVQKVGKQIEEAIDVHRT